MSAVTLCRYDPTTGEILQTVSCPANMAALQIKPGQSWVEGAGGFDTHHVVAGQLIAYTDAQRLAKATRPPHIAHWDNALMAWVDDRGMEQVRAAKWSQIKAARDAHENGGFDTAWGRFDSDPTSQTKLIGAAQLASIALAQGAPFGIEWTLQDNTSVPLDANQMISVGVALAAHIDAAHQRGRQLRAQIEAATTLQDLEAIQW